MKNKKLLSIVIVLIILLTTGCTNKDGIKFKEEYEGINGQTNDFGLTYRELELNAKNPFVYTTAEKIVDMVNDGETFYVYFGDNHCPWCRSVIGSAIDTANEIGIKKIYYVKIWEDFHEEILRDTYKLDENKKAVLDAKGTDFYYELLDILGDLLNDYTLTDSKGNIVEVGEKRIFAPNFVYVENGKPIELIDAISKKQDGYNGELTEEVLKDEKETFTKFFNRK